VLLMGYLVYMLMEQQLLVDPVHMVPMLQESADIHSEQLVVLLVG